MSMLRNVLYYMGLGPDEDYDDAYRHEDDEPHGPQRPVVEHPKRPVKTPTPNDDLIDLRQKPSGSNWLGSEGSAEAVRRGRQGSDRPLASESSASKSKPSPKPRTAPVRQSRSSASLSPSSVPSRPLKSVPPDGIDDSAAGITIRPVSGERRLTKPKPRPKPGFAKPKALTPSSFGEAKVLADEFKKSVPVILNLVDVERDLARRLIDFASGICYALDGGMEKVAPHVFLLTPESIEVTEDDRRRIQSDNYRNSVQ